MKIVPYYIISFCIAFASCTAKEHVRIPNLKETFIYTDSLPFGGSYAYGMFQDAYNDKFILTQRSTITDINARFYDDKSSLYYVSANNFFVDETEAHNLLQFVHRGNTVFIAAKEIDSILLQRLGVEQYSPSAYTEIQPMSFQNTSTSIAYDYVNMGDSSFSYYFSPFQNHFQKINNTSCQVLGRNNNNQPNFMVFFWGSGKLFLHCDSRAISNYFLLHNMNYLYMQNILSVLPQNPGHVYVDDYYCHRNYRSGKGSSMISFIYSRPALAWAFSIFLVGILMYILLNGKRRQRIIPVKKPVVNASVAFIEAISGLYYKQRDNKNIAEKMIVYFYEDLRTRFYLSNTVLNKDFISTVSKKSGMTEDATKQLFYQVKMVQDSEQIDDELLLQLSRSIENYKSSIQTA